MSECGLKKRLVIGDFNSVTFLCKYLSRKKKNLKYLMVGRGRTYNKSLKQTAASLIL